MSCIFALIFIFIEIEAQTTLHCATNWAETALRSITFFWLTGKKTCKNSTKQTHTLTSVLRSLGESENIININVRPLWISPRSHGTSCCTQAANRRIRHKQLQSPSTTVTRYVIKQITTNLRHNRTEDNNKKTELLAKRCKVMPKSPTSTPGWVGSKMVAQKRKEKKTLANSFNKLIISPIRNIACPRGGGGSGLRASI